MIALTDESGNVVERYAYDPWGKRRNPDDWEQPDSRTSWLVNRGYTGHEHLDQFGIINMNGRVYDPLTASFFSPDPYVQAPDNWLNYNRYAYAYGKPFRYTDPDGEWVHLVVGAVAGGLINWLSNGAAFSNDRHSNLNLSNDEITNHTMKFVRKNSLLLKEGDNLFQGTINGYQTTVTINLNDGVIRSISMYPNFTNRPTINPIIKFGELRW